MSSHSQDNDNVFFDPENKPSEKNEVTAAAAKNLDEEEAPNG